MVQLVDELLQLVAKGDEVDDEMIRIEGSGDFRRNTPVVPVQPLAPVADCDEMGRGEDEVVFRDADTEGGER